MAQGIKKRNINGIAYTVICGLMGISSLIAREKEPRLIIGIMVDQLRTDNLENLQDMFSSDGFNRLMKEGAFLKDVDFKVSSLDPASATAIVYTGNYPRYNGITSSKVYSPSAKDMVFALNDPSAIGNFTSETFSPSNLRLSTISDELKISTGGNGNVYSIAPDAQQAIIMAGHSGNSAFWINEHTGNWATTTFYRDNPQILTQRNYTHPITGRLDTLVWKPLPLKSAITGNEKDFTNRFPSADKNVYKMFTSSPAGNTEITDAAISYIETFGSKGKEEAPVMINIGYTAAPYNYTDYSRKEIEDIYQRLDKELGRLFSTIDRQVGMENVLIFLSSSGYYDDRSEDSEKYQLPTGVFSVKRALSLLNSYLSARYGNGNYVDTYSNRHIYLNHKEIEAKNLDLREVAEVSRDFLVKMSGINDAFSMADIMSSSLPSMEGLRLGTDPKTGGDVILEFNSGWKITDDSRFPVDTRIARSDAALTPAFFLGGRISPETIEETVDATAIAPTVAQILRIRSPNGASSKPILLKKK